MRNKCSGRRLLRTNEGYGNRRAVRMRYLCYMLPALASLTVVQPYDRVRTCHDIEQASKRSFKCKYITLNTNTAQCYTTSVKPTLTSFEWQVNLLEEVGDSSNDTAVTFCLGLSLFNKYLVPYHNDEYMPMHIFRFDPTQVVGSLLVSRRCWQEQGFCDGTLLLLDEVLELSIFHFKSVEESFWNFTSPLFSVPRKWLQELYLYVPTDNTIGFDWLSRLSNTSLEKLKIMNDYLGHVTIPLDIPDLKSFSLINSEIVNFYEDCFVGKPSLLELDLSNNVLQRVPHLRDVPRLQTLDLSNNFRANPFTVHPEDLATLHNLRSLNLSHTKLVDVTGALPLLPKLEHLYLSNCQIQSLADDAFRNQSGVVTLDLSGNLLRNLNLTTFASLLELEWLDLSSNQLYEWPPLYQMRLRLLNLASNNLTALYNLGHNGTSVERLDVSNNAILNWTDEHVFTVRDSHWASQTNREPFQGVGEIDMSAQFASSLKSISRKRNVTSTPSTFAWVKHVILSRCQISVLTRAMGLSLEVVGSVDLGGNPLDCGSCDMPFFQSWIQSTPCQILSSGVEAPLQCYMPVEKQGLNVTDIVFDNESCLPRSSNYWVSLVVVLTSVAVAAGVLYRYRLQISYMAHLYSIRRRAKKHSEDHDSCYDAFVCYSGQDRTWVLQRLAPFLEGGKERYRLCLHDRDFPLGSRIVDNIVGAIEKSRKVIVVVSAHFIDSEWCRWELEMANHKMFDDDQHFLVLIQLERLDRSKLPRHLKFLMDTRTYLQWPTDPDRRSVEHGYRRLRAALGSSIYQTSSERAPLISGDVSA